MSPQPPTPPGQPPRRPAGGPPAPFPGTHRPASPQQPPARPVFNPDSTPPVHRPAPQPSPHPGPVTPQSGYGAAQPGHGIPNHPPTGPVAATGGQPPRRNTTKPPKRSNGTGKKLIFIAVVILALLLAAKIAVSQLAGQQPAAPTPDRPADTPKADTPPPAKWEQRYDTTFLYSGQRVVINRVTITRLNKRSARVTYRGTVIHTDQGTWVKQKNTWRLGSIGVSRAPKTVRVNRVGRRSSYTVTFTWPRARLFGGSALVITIPDQRRTRAQIVRLALEVPKDRRGIQERTGDGGL